MTSSTWERTRIILTTIQAQLHACLKDAPCWVWGCGLPPHPSHCQSRRAVAHFSPQDSESAMEVMCANSGDTIPVGPMCTKSDHMVLAIVP